MSNREIAFRESDYLSHQWEYLNDGTRQLALVGGYGCGKTHTFIRKTFLNLATRKLEKRDNRGNLKEILPVSSGWVTYPTLGMAEELFVYPFQDMLDDLLIGYSYNKSKMLFDTELGDIKIYSLQRPQRMIGGNKSFIGFDEFDTESQSNCKAAYERSLARMRGCLQSQMYFVTTPEGFKTTYKIFVEEARKGNKSMIRAKTTDNPYLPESYIEDLKAQYDEKLLAQYLNGEFVNLNGMQALYMFNRDCIIDPIPESDYAGKNLTIGIDFNVDPFTATVSYMPSINHKITFHEFYVRNLGSNFSGVTYTDKMAQMILDKFPTKEWKAYHPNDAELQARPTYGIEFRPDMSGKVGLGKRQTSASLTDIQILKSSMYGIRVKGISNPRVKDRLAITNGALGNGKIEITSNCVELIKDNEQVVTLPNGDIDKSDGLRAQIIDAWTYDNYRDFFRDVRK